MRPIRYHALSLIVLFLLRSQNLQADDQTHPLAPPDTSSPRATLNSFRVSGAEVYRLIINEGGKRSRGSNVVKEEARRFLGCLDLSEVPVYRREATAKRSGVCLLEVFDRIELPPDEEVPFSPPEADDAEAAEFEPPGQWRIPNTEIVLHRVKEGPREGEYLFSPDTVERAPEFYERVKDLPYKEGASEGFYEWFLGEPGAAWLARVVRSLPTWTRERYFGQAVWQWVGLFIVIIAGIAFMGWAYIVGRKRARHFDDDRALRRLMTLWAPALALLVPWAVGWTADDILSITGGTLSVVRFATNFVFLLGVVVLVLAMGNRIADLVIASPSIHPRGIDAQFIRIVCRVVSLIAAMIVFLEGGQYLGIPLTTLLAGAGVGGLTVALAAQDTLRNIFGSMMILLDKPFRVGERIAVKGYDGVVQEIGLRSTKLRLLTGHEATIPNDELARSDVENIGRRLHIRRVTRLALPLDLPPQKCEQAVRIVRELLENHEGFDEAFPPRIYLDEFNRDSLGLRIFYWYHPPEYWEFMAFSEKLNLDIKREFAAADIPFALPTGKTFISHEGADAGQAAPDQA